MSQKKQSVYIDGAETPLGLCNYFVEECKCAWMSEECVTGYGLEIECGQDLFYGNCTYTTAEKIDNCATSGYITYIRGAVWDGPEELRQEGMCESYEKNYKCVETAKLGFFGLSSFIISSLIIVGIYIVLKKHL